MHPSLRYIKPLRPKHRFFKRDNSNMVRDNFISRALSGSGPHGNTSNDYDERKRSLSPADYLLPADPQNSIAKDPLPTDKVELEALLNFHLSQIGYLYKRLAIHNEEHDQDKITWQRISKDPTQKLSAAMLKDRMETWVEFRKTRGRHVAYHRGEIVRIERMMKKLYEEAGTAWVTPDCIKNLPNDALWADMFTE